MVRGFFAREYFVELKYEADMELQRKRDEEEQRLEFERTERERMEREAVLKNDSVDATSLPIKNVKILFQKTQSNDEDELKKLNSDMKKTRVKKKF